MGELADKINATCEAQEQATWPELAAIAERVAADHYREKIAACVVRVAELEEALRPFAEIADELIGVEFHDMQLHATEAEYQAARSALEGEKP